MPRILLGSGVLSWPASERRSDRYGVVGLASDASPEARFLPLVLCRATRRRGALLVEIVTTRASHHVGDLFHGFFPSTPTVGEEIGLGVGTLFYETAEREVITATPTQTCCYVGLKPSEERAHFWLDPPALYRCHDQTVNLYFIPEE
jgi:hypothetical protein